MIKAQRVALEEIQTTVAGHFNLEIEDMVSRKRPAKIAWPRQIAMYLSRKLTGKSFVEIGNAFGGREHGTVIHACKKVERLMEMPNEEGGEVRYQISRLIDILRTK